MVKTKIAHESFQIEKTYNHTPELVFSAWASTEAKSHWFIGPRDWVLIKRELDFKVGGREILHGNFGGTLETLFTAHFHDIIKNERIVFDYDMHMNGKILSSSIASIEIEEIGPKKTRLIFTEQVAFLDGTPGEQGVLSRKNGTMEHLVKIEAFLNKQEEGKLS
ncbi:ATPase [Leptospira langatensis]|uniref:ATPase n=1 Tax=Leptospira langatensis TaxID=2484983 RepID=A0A5F1ZQP7_9LEPT|nr:SRPBCC domain-containing protein [Leptospira langatensis]TGK05216.1 ATPase [Leptospira langatensis]TGL38352.1 ATPase [Leptospira langatensis]